jgi:hypothetical protein
MEMDVMLAFATNILPLLTNIKSVDIRNLSDDIINLWSQNGNELAKRILASANVLRTELVFIFEHTDDFRHTREK